MPVVGKNSGQSFPAHDLHRYAIRQAISLVRPRAEQIETSVKRTIALRNDAHRWVEQNCLHSVRGVTARMLRAGREKFKYSVRTSWVVTTSSVNFMARSWAASSWVIFLRCTVQVVIVFAGTVTGQGFKNLAGNVAHNLVDHLGDMPTWPIMPGTSR